MSISIVMQESVTIAKYCYLEIFDVSGSYFIRNAHDKVIGGALNSEAELLGWLKCYLDFVYKNK